MKSIRRTLAVLFLVASSFAGPTQASSFSNDQSDLWWNANESGWGIQFVQRGSTIFATMFVYDASGNPTWYVAAMQGTKPNGILTFSGDIYSVKGSWFGAVPFDPTTVAGVSVGTMTWQKQTGLPGVLAYSINGANVTKSLTRQPIGTDDYTGPYHAAIHGTTSGCRNPGDNGHEDSTSRLTISQVGTAINMALVDLSCTFNGTYSQGGQFGAASGSWSCDGEAGTFTFSNMNVTPYTVTMLVSIKDTVSGCETTGQIGGVRTDR
jgi:hypothetical protein